MENKVKIGLIGLGTVGSGVFKTLQNFDNIEVVQIAVRNKNKQRNIGDLDENIITDNAYDVVNNPDIDVIVELIGGLDPAFDLIKTAIKNGKHIVTANKELLAKHGYVHSGKTFNVVQTNKDKILLFCHFGVEAAILSHIFGVSPMPLWHNFCALPSSVTRIVTEEREEGIASFRTLCFGDYSHLFAGDEEPSFAARFCEVFTDETRH